MYRIGIDVGGTKIKGVVLNNINQCIFEYVSATPTGADYVYNAIVSVYKQLTTFINYSTHTVGIGIPGNSTRPSYLLEDTNVKEEFQKRIPVSVQIENDANCFALAEATLGAGKNASSVFGVILGTGVGGGVVINQSIYKGHSGLAGEWGHTPLYKDGIKCWCGQKGCVEQYISGRAIEKKYFANANLLVNSAGDVFANRDLISFAIVQDFYNDLAQGLANIINFYDPEVIVIGGGVSCVKEIYQIVPEKVEKLIYNTSLKTRIVENSLGNDAGAIGAALL